MYFQCFLRCLDRLSVRRRLRASFLVGVVRPSSYRLCLFSANKDNGAVVSFVGAIKDNAEPLLRRETPAPHSPHEQHEKIERQAQWAERLERQEHGPSSAHEHTETRFEGHGQRSSQRLEQLQIDLSEAIRYAKANQTEDTPEAGRTTCWRNTFIADWGSTGATVEGRNIVMKWIPKQNLKLNPATAAD
jgi:hypothetical protein